MANTDRSLVAQRIYRLFLELQRRNLAVGKLHGTELKLVESHLLTELDSHPEADGAALARLLALNQSTVSRLVSRLGKKGYLRSAPSNHDKRRLLLEITPKGHRAMRAIDTGADMLLRNFARGFSRADLERLRGHFQRFADGFGHPRSKSRPGEHPFRVEQRRIARCLHVLDLNDGGDGISGSEHQVLRLLHERHRPMSPSQIAGALAMQRSAMSVILKGLREQEYLDSAKNRHDGRGELVQISYAGQRALELREESRERELVRALKEFSEPECQDFSALLELFVAGGHAASAEFSRRFKIQKLKTDLDRGAARSFYLRWIAKNGNFEEVPAELFDAGSASFALYEGSSIVAVLQLRRGDSLQPLYASALNENDYPFDKIFHTEVTKLAK